MKVDVLISIFQQHFLITLAWHSFFSQLHDTLYDLKFNGDLVETSSLSVFLQCVPIASFYGFTMEQTMLSFYKLADELRSWWNFEWRASSLARLNRRERELSRVVDMNFMIFMNNIPHRQESDGQNDIDIAILDLDDTNIS